MAEKKKVEADRFTAEGVRLFNRTKPHGVIYSDGTPLDLIGAFEQEGVRYRADGYPIGYVKVSSHPASPGFVPTLEVPERPGAQVAPTGVPRQTLKLARKPKRKRAKRTPAEATNVPPAEAV